MLLKLLKLFGGKTEICRLRYAPINTFPRKMKSSMGGVCNLQISVLNYFGLISLRFSSFVRLFYQSCGEVTICTAS